MIDIQVQTLGGPEIAASLADADTGIRVALRNELAAIGDQIVSTAQGLAPRRTGILASKILWYFGEQRRIRVGERTTRTGRTTGIYRARAVEGFDSSGAIQFTARPTGTVAHLMERGVNATRKAHQRRVQRQGTIWTRKGRKEISTRGVAFVKAHTLRIAPREFFMPAVGSVGGAPGVNARLQAAIDIVAANVGRAA